MLMNVHIFFLIFACTSSRIEIFSMDELNMFLLALFLVSIKNLSELHGGINYPPVEKVTQRQEKGKIMESAVAIANQPADN